MRAVRIGVVFYGVAAGALMYADAHDSIGGRLQIALLAFGVLTGAVVGRAWALLALLGPLASLGYLQAIGFRELNHDGVDPLLSPPGISRIVWIGLALLIGIAIHCILEPLLARRATRQA